MECGLRPRKPRRPKTSSRATIPCCICYGGQIWTDCYGGQIWTDEPEESEKWFMRAGCDCLTCDCDCLT
jgi:hypothetical protein